MRNIIDIKLTSIFSPICQTLLNETAQQRTGEFDNKCTELFVIRLDGTIIAYATFKVTDFTDVSIDSLYFRNILKDHDFADFWLSRYLKRHVGKNTYLNYLMAL
ncbi:hypothetical protein [Psychromonas sp.]|uniref:hypothetical protein n=1 Tax=Psychromonas sp. TaxID=1884585 RepID=UPI00356704B8